MGDCAWDGSGEAGGGTGPLGIDYVRAYHCGFREHGWLFYPVLLGWGCFITYLMGHTADAYFSPTLATLSDKLKLTYDVAGVTFLALGNGAPDVFSSIAAFSSSDPEVRVYISCHVSAGQARRTGKTKLTTNPSLQQPYHNQRWC